MTASNYLNCVPVVRQNEGGFSDNSADPGGATMAGVTQRTYNAYRDAHSLSHQPVVQISGQEIAAIYREYWFSDDIPDGLDLMQFDASINSGPRAGVRWIQRAIGVTADGIIGPETIKAAQSCDVALAIRDAAYERLGFLRTLPTWPNFGTGWTNRVNRTEAAALAMVK